MDRLHLDAKLSIARTSIAAWNALMRADPIFGRYALSEQGRSMFLVAFTVIEKGEWRVAGKLHRVDIPGIPGSGGPARVIAGGTEEWYERGKLHRIGGPAITNANGSEMWYEYNKLHRIDGPACIYPDGSKDWYERGKLHRIGGPAAVYPEGGEDWYEHGEWHRIGGPARIYADGNKEWYEHGTLVRHPK